MTAIPTAHDEGRTDGRSRSTRVAVGLGSNVGDRGAHLARGVQGLGELLCGLRCSRVYETDPVGAEGHPRYLNMCCVGRAHAEPRVVLEHLLDVEGRTGRPSAADRADGPRPRTLDLDLLLYGDETVDEDDLTVPHPRMHRRAFVLVPLAEVAGEWRDPATGRTVSRLADRVDGSGVEPYEGELPSPLEEVIPT